MKNTRIVVTGTPGTGKTVISKLLSEKTRLPYIDTGQIAIQKGLVIAYDYSRKTYIVDEEKLGDIINKILIRTEEGCIIETIYPCIIESKNIDYIVVLKTDPETLMKRLEKRKHWPQKKVLENVETEFLDSILEEIRECHPQQKIIVVDTSDKTPEEVVEKILESIRSGF
jgi:adenylate kinase